MTRFICIRLTTHASRDEVRDAIDTGNAHFDPRDASIDANPLNEGIANATRLACPMKREHPRQCLRRAFAAATT